jgi:hypothetical protein
MQEESISTGQIVTNINPSESLETQMRNYVIQNNPKLYILTPCYGANVFVNYMCSLIQTIDLFRQYHFPLQVEFCKNDSLVSRARNNLIAKAMYDERATHFMFIDSDIAWNPLDIFKLILSEKALVGGVYPLKNYFWDKMLPSAQNPNPVEKWLEKRENSEHLKSICTEADMIQHNLLKYNINYKSNFLEIENNLSEVRHLATGFMMIRRELMMTMIQAFPSTKYVDDVSFLEGDQNKYAYALFDCGVEEGHYYSEDWMFCHRWKQLGGKIFIDISIRLVHTGIEDFRGSYISTIL